MPPAISDSRTGRARPTLVGKGAVAVIVAWIGIGLALDARCQPWGQPVVVGVTWLLFAWWFAHGSAERRAVMLAVLVFATAGEWGLAPGLGLYEYRLDGVPWFVPPGHVLLFLAGAAVAARLPRAVDYWVLAAALSLVARALLTGEDRLSAVLSGVFAVAWLNREGRRLYATMFLLALGLELWGTALGCWAWASPVPGVGWTGANPPLAAGALYCGLDLLTLATMAAVRTFASRREPRAAVVRVPADGGG